MNRSSNNNENKNGKMATSSPPPPPVPSQIPKIQYCVRSPWAWVMEEIVRNRGNDSTIAPSLVVASVKEIVEVDSPKQLQSSSVLIKHLEATPRSSARSRRRLGNSHIPSVSTLRMELLDNHSQLLPPALYGTSKAFDGLEDKDELVRTFQRCRCDNLYLSPPSFLIKWDVTREECKKIIKRLPLLDSNDGTQRNGTAATATNAPFAVLKEPMGAGGEGIVFVQSLDEIYDVVERHRRKALDEGPDFLDSVMARRGRIPSWVLQAEVHPCRLLKSKKFHIRTYVAGVEKLGHDDLFDVQVFRRHEVLIAARPMAMNDTDQRRDRLAHITNVGNSSKLTQSGDNSEEEQQRRVLLHDIPELREIQPSLEVFCANVFHSVWPDLVRRVSCTRQDTPFPSIRKFTMAGCDIMVTSEGRFYLLEVNVNPSAPPKSQLNLTFQRHLTGMLNELIQLLIQGRASHFASIFDLLAQQENKKRPMTNGTK